MQDIKYNQGFSDALACTTNVLETMLKEVEGVIKRKEISCYCASYKSFYNINIKHME